MTVQATPTKQNYAEMRGAILDDRSASFWLQGAVKALDARDPCDAIGDVEALLELTKLRVEEILGPYFPDRPDSVKQREARAQIIEAVVIQKRSAA
jgi:hypothetical protein